jgi:hypothetical protein
VNLFIRRCEGHALFSKKQGCVVALDAAEDEVYRWQHPFAMQTHDNILNRGDPLPSGLTERQGDLAVHLTLSVPRTHIATDSLVQVTDCPAARYDPFIEYVLFESASKDFPSTWFTAVRSTPQPLTLNAIPAPPVNAQHLLRLGGAQRRVQAAALANKQRQQLGVAV